MRRRIHIIAFALAATSICYGQSSPPPAGDILEQACKEAASANKNVFVIFHASWCGWCRKMDASMSDPACKKFFDDNFVIRHLVVYESSDKKNLENPGAMDLLRKYRGENQGIPYWFIFDKDGNLLADSRLRKDGAEPGDNTGCPATAEEVGNFLEVLRKTTHLNEDQLKIISGRFRKNETGE